MLGFSDFVKIGVILEVYQKGLCSENIIKIKC